MSGNSSDNINVSNQFNNFPFHVLVPYIAAFFSNKIIKSEYFQFNEINLLPVNKFHFRKTQGYKYFLEAFEKHYKLKHSNNTADLITKLLETYSHPLDLQVLLGPVLRQTLRSVLLNSKDHKNYVKKSFITLIKSCKEEYRSAKHPASASKDFKIHWLSHLQIPQIKQNEALFGSNISIIAKLLTSKNNKEIDAVWDEIYQNYCNTQCDQKNCANVSIEQFGLLCESFRFKLTNRNGLKKKVISSPEKPLADVIVLNKSKEDWKIVTTKENNWEYSEHPDKSKLKRYHDLSIQIFSQSASVGHIRILQDKFRDKINKFLTKNIEFNEEFYVVQPSFKWVNNNGLEGIAELLIQVVLENKKLVIKLNNNQNLNFLDSDEFESFLIHFRQYYKLSDDLSIKDIFSKLKELLLTYLTPQERYMLLCPVLRKMIKRDTDLSGISAVELIGLCRNLNLSLEFYLSQSNENVSCFDQIDEIFKDENTFDTLAYCHGAEGWHLIQKDPFKGLQATSRFIYSFNQAFQLTANKANITSADLKEFQEGITIFLRTGRSYIESNIRQSAKISRPANFKADAASIFDLAKHGTPLELKRQIIKRNLNVDEAK